MMRQPDGDQTAARGLRPHARLGKVTLIADSKVGQLLALLDRSTVPRQLEEMLDGRPGPPGVRPRTVLAGLLLSCYFTGRATIADAWRILHFRLRPKARTWLGIPEAQPSTARECIASSRRLYRGFDRITTLLDPARCDRRSRLPLNMADAYADAWQLPPGRQAAERLQVLANHLVLAPVRLALERGHLTGWRGDIGVDATAIPVLARPAGPRSRTAPVEVTAGWHFSGGPGEGTFGYSASVVVAAHRRPPSQPAEKPTAYPQLCVGMVLDTPTVRTGRNAILALEELAQLGVPAGTCAADRAYTGCTPATFQTPARQLGYQLALDYKKLDRGLQGSWHGALLIDGTLACPHTPAPLIHATTDADDSTVRRLSDEVLVERIAAREPWYVKTKQGPDTRGAVRCQCPGTGPSRSVNCARADRLRPHTPRTAGPPPAVLDLADSRRRAAHPATRPTVELPEDEWHSPPPAKQLPLVCAQGSFTLPADADGDAKTAKFRQDSHYLSADWFAAYKPIRAHSVI